MLNTYFRQFARSEACKVLCSSKSSKVLPCLKLSYNQQAFQAPMGYNFSSSPSEPPKGSNLTPEQIAKLNELKSPQTNKIHGLTLEEFINYIKDTQDKENINYKYQNKAIYALSGGIKDRPQISKITFDKAFWKTVYAFEALVWIPLSYVAYAYISPIAIGFPLIGFAATVFGTYNAQRLMENSIMRMDLINNQQVILYQWGGQGSGVVCNIKDAKITKTEIPPPKKPNPDADESENRQSASIEATFVETSSQKKQVKAVFLVSPDSSPIENVDLFRMILQGRESEIAKFEYIQPPPKEAQTTEKSSSENAN